MFDNRTGLGIEIIEAFRRGEEHAFDKVFRALFNPLTFYANKYVKDEKLSEDLVQDCFVELWRRRKKLQNVMSIRSYLYRMVYNRIIDQAKANKLKVTPLNYEPELRDILDDNRVIESEALAGIMQVIDTLPNRMKAVLQMYFLEEKSLDEIGAEIGIDPETVRSHRYRAIQLVRKTLGTAIVAFVLRHLMNFFTHTFT